MVPCVSLQLERAMSANHTDDAPTLSFASPQSCEGNAKENGDAGLHTLSLAIVLMYILFLAELIDNHRPSDGGSTPEIQSMQVFRSKIS